MVLSDGHSQHNADQARLHIHTGDHIREGRGKIFQIHNQGLAVKKEYLRIWKATIIACSIAIKRSFM